MSDEYQDARTEPASERRRQEFRERGEVARSREVPSAAILLATAGVLSIVGPTLVRHYLSATSRVLGTLHEEPDLTVTGATALSGRVLAATAFLLAPVLLAATAAAFLATVSQTGVLFTARPLLPDFNRINPLGKFGQVFLGPRALVEAIKALLKVVLVGVPVYLTVTTEFGRLPALSAAGAGGIALFCVSSALQVIGKVGLLLALLALLDYLWQRLAMERRMRMTVQEVKEENKELVGNPQIKGRIRQIQRALALGRLKVQVEKADVVVTNPTHYAVALSYRSGEMRAPRVVAKGKGYRAQRIKDIARAAGVPTVENRALARELYRKVRVGREIPPGLYRAVAEVLAYVYRRRRHRPGRNPAGRPPVPPPPKAPVPGTVTREPSKPSVSSW